MTESLVDRIKRHEGFIQYPKPDAKGAFVVGYGHDIPESDASNYSGGISDEDACNLLNADIEKATDGVNSALPWVTSLSELRQEVLVELAFWIGLGGLLKFHNTLNDIKNGAWGAAADGLLNSLLHTQIPGRTEELANILLNDSVDTASN